MHSYTRYRITLDRSTKVHPWPVADDPYYCGLRARVPNFVKMAKSNGQPPAKPQPGPAAAAAYAGHVSGRVSSQHHHHHHQGYGPGYPIVHSQSSQIYGHPPVLPAPAKRPPIMYHARSFESGLGTATITR